MATKEETTPMFNIINTTGKSPSMEATEFAVQIITMNKSLYVWIGSADARSQRMDNLTAALTSRSSATIHPPHPSHDPLLLLYLKVAWQTMQVCSRRDWQKGYVNVLVKLHLLVIIFRSLLLLMKP